MRDMKKIHHQKILVVAKACPAFSKKYKQVVCTAGVTDEGKWIRIYPVQFRRLLQEERFKKYQWIEVDLIKDCSDPRPESYKICGKIRPKKFLDCANDWRKRKLVFHKRVKHNLMAIIDDARNLNKSRSLAIFKPRNILGFYMRENLNPQTRKKYPYKFYYKLVDKFGKKSEMQIIDWEIYELCRKLINKYGRKSKVIYSEIRGKYFDFMTKQRDVYLILGTSRYWHIRRSSNPFMIIGVFYPPK